MKTEHKRLIGKGAVYSVGSVLEKALTVVLLPVYTRYLYPEAFGIIAIMLVTVGLINKLLIAPETMGLIRHYFAPGFEEKQKTLVFNLFLIILLKTLPFTVLFFAFAGHIAGFLLGEETYTGIIRIFAFVILFQSVSGLGLTVLRMEEKAKSFIAVSIIGFLVSAAAVLVLLIGFNLGVTALVWGYLINPLVVFVLLLPYIMSKIKIRWDFDLILPVLFYGYPLLVSAFSNMLIQAGDRYVLKALGTLSMVGVYSFGYAVASIVNVVLVVPLKQINGPVIFKMENDEEKLKKFLRDSTTYIYFVMMMFGLLLSLFSGETIRILAAKKEFWAGWVIVPIIVFSYVQHGLGACVSNGLVLAKKTLLLSGMILTAAVLNIGLNFLLIPVWGIVGAALATMISYIVWNSLKIYFTDRYFGLKFQNGRLIHITAAAAAVYMVSLFVAPEGNSQLLNILWKCLLFVSFPVLMYFTGFFEKWEKERLKAHYNSMRKTGLAGFIKERIDSIKQS
ncbi:MAG: polysaccharide biosynthesis protein [Elusimicrobia bacterium]|nr:polysaccharide biosynthesis protein [Elusimicrobiota bacterium]